MLQPLGMFRQVVLNANPRQPFRPKDVRRRLIQLGSRERRRIEVRFVRKDLCLKGQRRSAFGAKTPHHPG